MRGLNEIFRNASRVRILRVLHHAEKPLSGRAVQRLAGLSNRATMTTLEALVEARVVTRQIEAGTHLYRLNRNHYLTAKVLRRAFDAEEAFWLDVKRTVQRVVRPRPLAAVATGPLAREETDYGGRLFLTVLFSTGRRRIRALVSMEQLSEVIRDRYAMTLEYDLLDMNTMDRQEYDPLWRRVEREGILLFGSLP